MEGDQRSFSTLVFGRAVSDTTEFFGYTRRDLLLGSLSLILGGVCAYVFVGRVDTMNEITLMGAFTFAPAALLLFTVFVWHLWLAPAALAFESSNAAIIASAKSAIAASAPVSKVHWDAWKHKETYTLWQLAVILAQADPLTESTYLTEENSGVRSYVQLIMEQIEKGDLEFIQKYQGPREKLTWQHEVPRKAALKWAKRMGFSVAHVE